MIKKNSRFIPQVTTKNSFDEDQKTLYNAFREAGTTEPVAEAIAHSFPNFMLGYITERGVGNALVKSGATEAFAVAIANLFASIKRSNATMVDRDFPPQRPFDNHKSPTQAH